MTNKQALCIALTAIATGMTGCATFTESESEVQQRQRNLQYVDRIKLDMEIEEYNKQLDEYYKQLFKYEDTRWTLREMPLPIRLIFLVGNAETLSKKKKELQKKDDNLNKMSEQIDRKWKALYD